MDAATQPAPGAEARAAERRLAGGGGGCICIDRLLSLERESVRASKAIVYLFIMDFVLCEEDEWENFRN